MLSETDTAPDACSLSESSEDDVEKTMCGETWWVFEVVVWCVTSSLGEGGDEEGPVVVVPEVTSVVGDEGVVDAGVGAGRALDRGGGASGLFINRRGEEGVEVVAVARDCRGGAYTWAEASEEVQRVVSSAGSRAGTQTSGTEQNAHAARNEEQSN